MMRHVFVMFFGGLVLRMGLLICCGILAAIGATGATGTTAAGGVAGRVIVNLRQHLGVLLNGGNFLGIGTFPDAGILGQSAATNSAY